MEPAKKLGSSQFRPANYKDKKSQNEIPEFETASESSATDDEILFKEQRKIVRKLTRQMSNE